VQAENHGGKCNMTIVLVVLSEIRPVVRY
jgi:hypothetical protein